MPLPICIAPSTITFTNRVNHAGIVTEMGPVALMTRGLPLRIIMVGTLTGAQHSGYAELSTQGMSFTSFSEYGESCTLPERLRSIQHVDGLS